ncbi:hypothetical protein HPB51_022608 [Rhipicephalus microplus]|uniref:CWH43-like N-terminal domain-containing protein n=1 Tax=Rhipicephalus microplus TaxID=6941 RepID=A0A9J6DXL1_RHIMP|nr:hypothetical protein HPB51_022608 [Rhipicephalus microplus]
MEPSAGSQKVYKSYKHTLSNLGFFARFGSAFSAATIIAVYVIAVANHDIDPYKSFVSDASGDPPQSGLFGLCIVIMIVMGFPVVYLHHMQNQVLVEAMGGVGERLNSLALASGSLSCLGMAVVALNPMSHVRRDGLWTWPVFVPHLIGAVLFFVTAFVHMLAQTRLMYALAKASGGGPSSTGTAGVKTLLTGIASVCVVFKILNNTLSVVMFAPFDEDFYIKYPPNASFSIAAEWVFVFCYLLYFATYASDFQDCTFFLDIYVLDYDPPHTQPPPEL